MEQVKSIALEIINDSNKWGVQNDVIGFECVSSIRNVGSCDNFVFILEEHLYCSPQYHFAFSSTA